MVYQNRNARLFSFYALIFVLVAVSLTGCRKDDVPPGSVSGTILPGVGPISISLTSPSGEIRHTTTPNMEGKFFFSSVEPGDYKLRIVNSKLYLPVADVDLSVRSNQATVVPDIYMQYKEGVQNGVVELTIDGIVYDIDPDSLFLAYVSSTLIMQGRSPGYPDYHSFVINLENVHGPGTYDLTSYPNLLYVAHYETQGVEDGSWMTGDPDAPSTLTITSLDVVNRTISGNFSGTMTSMSLPREEKPVSGEFIDVAY